MTRAALARGLSLVLLAACSNVVTIEHAERSRRHDAPVDDARYIHDDDRFNVPAFVDARSCVPSATVEALVQRGELHAVPIEPSAPAESQAYDNATALYLRVDITATAGSAGHQMQLDALGRGGSPGYSGMPRRGFVTLERVYTGGVDPDPMMLCDCSCELPRDENDPSGAWCTDTAVERQLQALRVVVPGMAPIELRRPKQDPDVTAYVADSPDGRILVRVRHDAPPFGTATVGVRRIQGWTLHRVPVALPGARNCFYDLTGTSHLQVPLRVAVITPFSWQTIHAEVLLPEAPAHPARFGPVRPLDFDLLLRAHSAWLGARAVPQGFGPMDWPAMRAQRNECPDRPTGPARAVLDGVDLAGLTLEDRRLQRASLRDAGLANADLDQSDLCGADLTGADLRRAHASTIALQKATLERADARSSDLWGNMDGSSWRGADLRGANFGGSFVGVDLSNADLRGARVYGDLSKANLQGARLDKTKLVDADLRSALGLTQAQLDGACGSGKTKVPKRLHIAGCE